MKKMLFVLSLLMVCSVAASATDYAFTLRDTNGNPYCNVAYVHWYSSNPGVTPKALVGGWYYNAMCDGNFYPGGGFKFAVSSYYQYGSGAVLALNSPAYYAYTGNAFQLLVNKNYHTWTIYWDTDMYGNYLVNYGTWINGASADAKGSTRDAAQR
ncbi:MAG: hypothetical protein HY233_00625 [Acidobacteriales bacterium]|nr:hypothetical protein [Terriglobales bacterium]